jgi:3-deoxy-D-manno-octulosonate 8-phosphate phosphatase (KDO 8-P phosphatase)
MQNLIEKAKKIKLAVFDVDGIFTNGILHYDENGIALKQFHVHDGVGIKLLQQAGIQVGIITAHNSPVVKQRMNDLGITHVYHGQLEKLLAYEDLKQKLGFADEQISYMGDDLPDLPVICRAGLGITVSNAPLITQQYATWVTSAKGGEGAVREVCDFILKAQDLYQPMIQQYIS